MISPLKSHRDGAYDWALAFDVLDEYDSTQTEGIELCKDEIVQFEYDYKV